MPRQTSITPHRNLGCLGWVIVWVGIALLLHEDWGLAWAGLAISIGVVYFIRAFRDPGQEGAILPAVILLISGATILSQLEGWTAFEMWRIWPIILGSAGLGLSCLWALNAGGTGTLVIGGILLVAFGYGIASPSWYHFLRDLSDIVEYWPLLMAIVGLILLFGHRRKRLESNHS